MVTLRGKSLIFKFDTLPAPDNRSSFIGIGSDSVAFRIQHLVKNLQTNYALVIEEKNKQATGKSAIAFRNTNSSGNYMKTLLWTYAGNDFKNTAFGIDVGNVVTKETSPSYLLYNNVIKTETSSYLLYNRMEINTDTILLTSANYAATVKAVSAGVDVDNAIVIRHVTSDENNSNSYGLLLEEKSNRADGRSALSFLNIIPAEIL